MKYLNYNGLLYFWTKMKSLLLGKEDKTNKVTGLSSSSTDSEYPSAKCVYDLVGDIESILTELTTGNGV